MVIALQRMLALSKNQQ